MTANLERNFRETQEAIATEAKRAGRRPEEITLLAVTKSVGAKRALELTQLGQTHLGENRLPSLLAKRKYFDRLGAQAKWHFIGHIQRNKARKVVLNSDVLHSVDTLQLIDTLDRIAGEESRTVPIYLEVKLTNEDRKHGFDPAELPHAIERAGAAQNLEVLGLMTMAARREAGAGEGAPLPEFQTLSEMATNIGADPDQSQHFHAGRVELSMGMSGDFGPAIQSGSHVVRIGSALYRGLEPEDQPIGANG